MPESEGGGVSSAGTVCAESDEEDETSELSVEVVDEADESVEVAEEPSPAVLEVSAAGVLAVVESEPVPDGEVPPPAGGIGDWIWFLSRRSFSCCSSTQVVPTQSWSVVTFWAKSCLTVATPFWIRSPSLRRLFFTASEN